VGKEDPKITWNWRSIVPNETSAFFGTPPYRNTITVLCEEGKRALGLALGRRITGRLCYRIRLVVFSESAFVPLVCVTKPALGLEAMKVVRNSVASATTECPSSMTFIRCF